MVDTFKGYTPSLESPASDASAVAPSDTADLPSYSRGLNVANSGFVRLTTVSGATETIYVTAGGVFPIRASRIWATGTTATGIVALS